MAKVAIPQDSLARELAEIKTLLQTLVILEGARAGMNRDEVRDVIGVKTERVSDVWKKIKKKAGDTPRIGNG